MCFPMIIGETETEKLIQRLREAARKLNRQETGLRKRANERSGVSRSERAREHERDRERERKKEKSIEFFCRRVAEKKRGLLRCANKYQETLSAHERERARDKAGKKETEGQSAREREREREIEHRYVVASKRERGRDMQQGRGLLTDGESDSERLCVHVSLSVSWRMQLK